MKLYADTPVRRTRQLVGDLLTGLWIISWIWVATKVHDVTLALAVPGQKLADAGDDLAGRLRDAGGRVGDVPLVGNGVRDTFDGAGQAADGMARAGEAQVSAVDALAFWLSLSVALIPILLAIAIYLPFRVRFVRRATAGRKFVDGAPDLDLFALRAMANQPLHVLARLDSDPAGAWRRGDRQVINALATLELRSVGLRPPPEPQLPG